MKQRDLLKSLRQIAKDRGTTLDFIRHGADHDQYRIGGYLIPVPRHREINERTAKGIIADAAEHLNGEGR